MRGAFDLCVDGWKRHHPRTRCPHSSLGHRCQKESMVGALNRSVLTWHSIAYPAILEHRAVLGASSISWTFLLEEMAPAKLDTFCTSGTQIVGGSVDSGQNQSPGNEDVPVCNNCWAQEGASAGLLATQGPTPLSLDALCDRWQSYRLGQRLSSCPSRRRRRQAGHRGKPKGAMGRGKGKDSEWPSNWAKVSPEAWPRWSPSEYIGQMVGSMFPSPQSKRFRPPSQRPVRAPHSQGW